MFVIIIFKVEDITINVCSQESCIRDLFAVYQGSSSDKINIDKSMMTICTHHHWNFVKHFFAHYLFYLIFIIM